MIFLLQAPPPEAETLSAAEVLLEYLGFASWFAVFGALGFRFAVLRRGIEGDAAVAAAAGRGAARIGAIGAALMLLRTLVDAARAAGEHHVSLVEQLQRGGARTPVPPAPAPGLVGAVRVAAGGGRGRAGGCRARGRGCGWWPGGWRGGGGGGGGGSRPWPGWC